MSPAAQAVARWHAVVADRDPAALPGLLHDEVVFRSPVVHTPQRGRDVTALYLAAALQVLGDSDLAYVHELVGDDRAVLEFTADLDGTLVNGVDIVDAAPDGRIVGFTVMVRPLQAIDELHRRMGAKLAELAPSS